MTRQRTRSRQRTTTPDDRRGGRPSREAFSKVRVRFDSDGDECVGWLYRPDRPDDPPVVVMAPGLGAERTFGYPAIAERLAEGGYAVLLFDYRNFGDSEGEPRNLVSPSRQVADWREAVAAARDFDGVDGSRVVLWGHSFAGGHALSVAAEDPRIAAVVAVAPFVDGRAALKSKGIKYNLKATALGLRDKLQSLALGAYTVPIVGDPQEFAVVNEPGAKAGVFGLVPTGSDWENRCPARTLLAIPRYRPITSAEDVRCPTLFVGGTDDEIVSLSAIESAAETVQDATYLRLPTDHFGFFDGDTFEEALGHQLAFLNTVVK
ncbi:Alpha/beta hydrolase family protein [Halogranum amylolyticum]|uniref:Alpha/beta hydrolase family protein n=1 Tax=Halogranum amylolyticum TaxID=660520 RepID=A0A1H8NDE0_9EURY|nr:alpha/beta fold hydrolase [Halogranum amylolyticum]SEO27620.1 Alpha/beta hydrolase family protein [Halogranum amylolyticum]